MRSRSNVLVIVSAVIGALLVCWVVFVPSKDQDYSHLDASEVGRVLLIPDQDTLDIYLYLIFPNGEAANPFNEGLAHYVEHLAWLSAFGGAESRHSNAWTNQFTTGYWIKTNADGLASALRRLASTADPLIVEEDFAQQERQIVLREYDFRVSERPLLSVFRDMDRRLYGGGSLARSVIGNPSQISTYSFDIAKNLHSQSHNLTTATLLAYGNVNERLLRAAISSAFGERSNDVVGQADRSLWVNEATFRDDETVLVTGLTEDTFLYRKIVPIAGCDGLPRCELSLQIAENALNSSLPGGLSGPLRFDEFVARGFSFNLDLVGGEFVELRFLANPDEGVSLEDLEQTFHSTLRATLEGGLPNETFDRILSRYRGSLDGILGTNRPLYNRDRILEKISLGKAVFSFSEERLVLEDIRLEDVNRLLEALSGDGREVTRRALVER